MKLIEKFLLGKEPDQARCEDGIYEGENFVAVVDGATSKSNFSYDGKSSGRMATEIILERLNSLSENTLADAAISELNKAIYDWYKKIGVADSMETNAFERCTAAVIIYSVNKKEIWQVGDCQALVDNKKITNEKYIDELLANLRAFVIESELLEGKELKDIKTIDVGRETIYPFLKRQSKFQNITEKNKFSYEIIDGFFWDVNAIKITKIPESTQEIVLASDGYPKLFSTLAESEAYLAELLRDDPMLYQKYQATKGLVTGNNSFDDRSYVRISLK